jgi:chaperone required for assembly of F1-ATPase
MKRFYKAVTVSPAGERWQVMLDGRAVKTQGGRAQLVPTRALAEALAAEWAGQGEQIDPGAFLLRDMADHALDVIASDRIAVIADLLRYAETDTLCYRADPGEPLEARQNEQWEPLLEAAEVRWDIHFIRIAGVIHQPQPTATLARLEAVLDALDEFALAALTPLTTLAASLVIGLAALEPGAEVEALWDAASLEEDWQGEFWGSDAEAEARRKKRYASFAAAVRFAELTRG